MFYITELQKRYKDQKEKKQELKKSSVQKSNDEKIVAESESSEMESLNTVLNSHDFEPKTGLAQVKVVQQHPSSHNTGSVNVRTSSQAKNHQNISDPAQHPSSHFYHINGMKLDEQQYQEYKRSLQNQQRQQNWTNYQNNELLRDQSTTALSQIKQGYSVQPNINYQKSSSQRGILKKPPISGYSYQHHINPSELQPQAYQANYGSAQHIPQVVIRNKELDPALDAREIVSTAYNKATNYNLPPNFERQRVSRSPTQVQTHLQRGIMDPQNDAREIVATAYNTVMNQYGGGEHTNQFRSVITPSEMGNTVSSEITYGTPGLRDRRGSYADPGSNANFVDRMGYKSSGGLNDLLRRYQETQI